MIAGAVNSRHEALIRLPILDTAGTPHDVEIILDTGFNGSLTLPTSLIAQLSLPWYSPRKPILGKGQEELFDVHAATVIWDGVPRPVLAHAMNTAPMLGMALLAGHDLRIRAVVGGRVEIQAVP